MRTASCALRRALRASAAKHGSLFRPIALFVVLTIMRVVSTCIASHAAEGGMPMSISVIVLLSFIETIWAMGTNGIAVVNRLS